MTSVIFLNESTVYLPFREELLCRLSPAKHPQTAFAFSFAETAQLLTRKENPALLVVAWKDFIALGPLYQPGKSVCFACLHHWLKAANDGQYQPSSCPGPEEARVAADLMSYAALTNSLDNARLRSAIQTFDLAAGSHVVHPVYPLRNCKTCSTVEVLGNWGLRIHCSSLTGIVRKMQVTKTVIAGAYRAIATWTSPVPVGEARPLLKTRESHGRGRTREEAEQGCIGEALERYSLIYRGDEPLQRGRLRDVSGVDPRDVLLYSNLQYESREQWNRTADERYFVGERFDPEREIDWFPGVDLADGSPRLLPAACVLMWYSFRAGESEYARGDSIGCASGWTLDDALAHALLEWIERDAMAIWWYNRIRRPSVTLESFAMKELLNVREELRSVGRNLILLDCTTDFGVPTYVSVAPRFDGTELLFAGASHLSPRIAAWKAASEVGQLWFSAVLKQTIDPELKSWLTQSIDAQSHLLPTHEIEAPPEPRALNSRGLVSVIVDRLRRGGLRAYGADLSRTDVILKTARVIVPGLRHIWNRRGLGRLYDVPVRLGWLEASRQECQLNPICCMI